MLYPCSYNKQLVPKECCFIINCELKFMKDDFCKGFDCEEIYIQKAETIKEIGADWMSYCRSLKEFNTDGLTSLTTVGPCWMRECKSLKEFNTNGLLKLPHTQLPKKINRVANLVTILKSMLLLMIGCGFVLLFIWCL